MDLGTAAVGLSLGSMAFKAGGDYLSSRGTAAGDTFKSEELDAAAQYGELQANQTNAQMTRNLAIKLGNIDAVRAAARTDPTSPTGAAVRDYVEYTGTEDKNIKVDSILEQSRMDEANAAYMRSAASNALLAGDIAMGGDIVGGLGGAVKGMGGGGGGGGMGDNP